MNWGRSAGMAWWSATTIFVSAFLLFQVQPVISKTILPWFGGSPAVWTTALLFFQTMLLAGYAYAHVLIRYVPLARQPLVHVTLLLLALLSLPITPGDFWKPADGSYPAGRILLLLLAKVGPTYFLLASTGPLIQAWFSEAYPGRSPYRLYALSNFGSLLALLSYPFAIELWLNVQTQGTLWSLGFVVFGILIGIMSLGVWRLAAEQRDLAAKVGSLPDSIRPAFEPAKDEQQQSPPTVLACAGWILLAALGTTALCAFTNHVCQDISVDPIMWVVPLSLYLISLIICFDSPRWYSRRFWGPLAIGGIAYLFLISHPESFDGGVDRVAETRGLGFLKATLEKLRAETILDGIFGSISWVATQLDKPLQYLFNPNFNLVFRFRAADWDDNLVVQGVTYVTILFLICMVAHGELARSKPAPKHLTMYFLMISAGGALGGLFVAIVCPLLFRTYFELPIAIVAGLAVAWLALAKDGMETWMKDQSFLQWLGSFVAVGSTLMVAIGMYEEIPAGTIVERNFYGTLSVVKQFQSNPEYAGYALHHGRILHGFQYRLPIQEGDTVLDRGASAENPPKYEAIAVDGDTVTLRDGQGNEFERRLDDWSLEVEGNPEHHRQREPITYYIPDSGVGLAAMQYPRTPGEGMKVAVIGLGTGTMAAHGQAGDSYRFYDIDPKVVAMSDKYFTYRSLSPAKSETVLGDARIQMEREAPQEYDLIVLDAFTGDAIPGHLLTLEAFAQYIKHLKQDAAGNPTGIIAIHISNRYLDLEPVVAALARHYDLPAKKFTIEEDENYDTASDWILVTRNEKFWRNPLVAVSALPLAVPREKELLWTDQRSSLLPILK
jgi:hypothetical protein